MDKHKSACGRLAEVNESLWQDNVDLRSQLVAANIDAANLLAECNDLNSQLEQVTRERDRAQSLADMTVGAAHHPDDTKKIRAFLTENRVLLARNGNLREILREGCGFCGDCPPGGPLDPNCPIANALEYQESSQVPLTAAEAKRVERLEMEVDLLDKAWAKLADDAEWECDCAVCADIRALSALDAKEAGDE